MRCQIDFKSAGVLEDYGPLVQVCVTYPVDKAWQPDDMPIKDRMMVNALIDTGSSHTILSPKLISKLGLKSNGTLSVRGLGSSLDQKTYYGRIVFSFPFSLDLKMTSSDINMPFFDVIIGRDIIRKWDNLLYDGKRGFIIINF